MNNTHLPAGTLLAARILIDATSTFSPTSTTAENQATLSMALRPLEAKLEDGTSPLDIACGAVICMQWLVSRASESVTDNEEILWSLREFISALQQEDPTSS